MRIPPVNPTIISSLAQKPLEKSVKQLEVISVEFPENKEYSFFSVGEEKSGLQICSGYVEKIAGFYRLFKDEERKKCIGEFRGINGNEAKAFRLAEDNGIRIQVKYQIKKT